MDHLKENKLQMLSMVAVYVMMIGVNAAANALPINGVSTGQVSDAYLNLFAPAGLTFSIWGLIYLLLGGYVVYSAFLIRPGAGFDINRKISVFFLISSLANGAWIFAWHYDQVPLSMILMVIILVCLVQINTWTSRAKLSKKERFFIGIPFSVYYGWITVAAFANATVLALHWNWSVVNPSGPLWAIVMMGIGALVGLAVMLKNKDVAYGLVLIWAYGGIYLKHTTAEGFDGRYEEVITAAVICISLFLLAQGGVLYLLYRNRENGGQNQVE